MLTDAAACIRALWRQKIAWSIALTLFFCVPYFTVQRVVLMPVRTFPSSAVDNAIAFDPRWVWAYQSGYLLMSIGPWLIDRRRDLMRYVRGFVRVSLVGFAFFLLLPVEGPRPALVPDHGMYSLLVAYDRPTNEFPSLHVALLAFTILVAARASRERMPTTRRLTLLSMAAAWAAAVAYAAVATKQHYAIDLAAGLVLAWAVDRWTP